MGNIKTVKEDWDAIIASKLKDGITIEDLKHKYASGIVMEPNVVSSDIETYDHTLNVSKPWTNMASIKGGSSSDKNRLALKALQEGANGLSIELTSQDSIVEILKDILTEYLDVRIDCRQLTKESVESQKSLINAEEFPNVRWVNQDEGYDQFHIGSDSKVVDIKTLVDFIYQDIKIDIVVSLSKNILFEIATIRAIRALMDELEVKSYNIIADYEVEGNNDLGDYNLIERTYKVISGVLGGADAVLTSYAGDEESRLTLNIHNILDLESGMKNVLDPLGGSFYIEKLTGEIIKEVKVEG